MTIGVALHPCRRRQKKIGQRRGDGDVILETEVNMLQPQGMSAATRNWKRKSSVRQTPGTQAGYADCRLQPPEL